MSGGLITGGGPDGDARASGNLPEGVTPGMTMGLHPRWRRPGDPVPRPPRETGPGKPQQRESVTLTRPKGGDGKR